MRSIRDKNIVIAACAFGVGLIAANYTWLIAQGKHLNFGLYTIIALILAAGGLYVYFLPIKAILGQEEEVKSGDADIEIVENEADDEYNLI